jgi:hypothetical protein
MHCNLAVTITGIAYVWKNLKAKKDLMDDLVLIKMPKLQRRWHHINETIRMRYIASLLLLVNISS